MSRSSSGAALHRASAPAILKRRWGKIEAQTLEFIELLDPEMLPPIYLAYHDALSEPTEVFHNDIRARFDRGEEKVVDAMKHFAALAASARVALLDRDAECLGRLMNENFDTRRSIYNLPPWQVQMVEIARRCGASAKFAGSGGAIIGTYRDEVMFEELCQALGAIHSRVIKPQVTPAS